MDSLVSLPFDLQMILVAGFLAYKVSVIGRGAVHTTEDFLLQVIAFGTVARGMAICIEFASAVVPPSIRVLPFVPELRLFAVGLLSVLIGLIVGMVWRRWLGRKVSAVMRDLKVYRDDHEHSAWATVTNTPAAMTVVQVHLNDKTVLIAEFDGTEDALPMRPITFNADGIAMFVTEIYPATGGDPRRVERDPDTFGYTITYIPKEQIKQVDVSLKQ